MKIIYHFIGNTHLDMGHIHILDALVRFNSESAMNE